MNESSGDATLSEIGRSERRVARHATTPAPPPLNDAERYTVEGEVARGGLGRILRVHDRKLDRTLAVKLLVHGGREAAARFAREATVTARLQHPSIVPVHETGVWPTGEPFYSMKLISGHTLHEAIARAATLRDRLALLPHVVAVAEAIAYAHAQGVIHRDLKPANILVGPFGETVVIDWGLAHDRLQEEIGQPGDVVGTPAFMPPEQASGGTVDEQVDVYAIGAVLYQLLTGAPPYSGSRSTEILARVRAERPAPLSLHEPRVPEDLAAIVDKAMARDPRDRYASARELAEDLRRFHAGRLVGAHRYSLPRLLWRALVRHAAIVAVTAAALLLLAGLGVVAMRRVVTERAAAVARTNELRLLQAHSALDKDPTLALAWLKSYPATARDWPRAAQLAADAASRGHARHLLRGSQGTVRTLAF